MNINIWPASREKGPSDIYTKSVDPDQTQRLRRRVWSGSALFDNRHINNTYFPCCVYILIMNMCFKHPIGADLGQHCMKCPKVPFRVTLAKCKVAVYLDHLVQFLEVAYTRGKNKKLLIWCDTKSCKI